MSTKVFLDNNILNLLVDDPEHRLRIGSLRLAKRSGAVVYLGTVALIEEVAQAAWANPAKFTRLFKVYQELVGFKTLEPLATRIERELTHGGLLPDPPLVPKSLLKTGYKSTTAKSLRTILPETFEIKDAHLEFLTQARREAKERGVSQELVIAWNDSMADVDRWATDSASRPPLNWDSSVLATYDRLPSNWMWWNFWLARLRLTLGQNRRDQNSDLADANHVSALPYLNIFVTEDRGLRETLATMHRVDVSVLTAVQFADWVDAHLDGERPRGSLLPKAPKR